MIWVVTGILIRDRRIFLQQRRGDDSHAPYRWETPGGKIEAGEALHDALRREWREELGLFVQDLPEQSFWRGAVGKDGNREMVDVFLTAYLVPDRGQGYRPVPQEGQGTGWFTREQLFGLRGSLNYGNELMLDELARLLPTAGGAGTPCPLHDGSNWKGTA